MPGYKQAAGALYKLGSRTGSLERDRIALNIGKGTVQQYLWQTIDLLARLAPQYIQWPPWGQRFGEGSMFDKCIGCIDGSIIKLHEKPKYNNKAYFSYKKNYELNLQDDADEGCDVIGYVTL